MSDIVVTWPKSRPFGSYMVELERAKARGLLVNFRLPNLPSECPDRCYRVHDGRVRGYLEVVIMQTRGPREVERVLSDPLHNAPGHRFWAAGKYLVCSPAWHEVRRQVKMPGFRGWRWFDRTLVES